MCENVVALSGLTIITKRKEKRKGEAIMSEQQSGIYRMIISKR
jgi:hypothetical protein